MLEADGYLRQAASNFQLAEAYLIDAEEQLRKLVERLENCSKLINAIPKDELLLWEQVDAIIQDSHPADNKELKPVSS